MEEDDEEEVDEKGGEYDERDEHESQLLPERLGQQQTDFPGSVQRGLPRVPEDDQQLHVRVEGGQGARPGCLDPRPAHMYTSTYISI